MPKDTENGLETMLEQHGVEDFKWIRSKDIVVAHWVRLKCRFGCDYHGKAATCPPNNPSVPDCRSFFSEYGRIALLHYYKELEKPEDRHAWTRKINRRLIDLERAVFLAGYHKALVLFIDPCNFCDTCVETRAECRRPSEARPAPEGLAVDVFSTARNCGYRIDVLRDYTQGMNRFGMLLVE